jgi:hypothetical protein
VTLAATVDPKESGTSLTRALKQLVAIEGHNLPDVVIPLRELTWSPAGTVVIPSYGEARPNDWARHQISNLLGIRFDRWFEAASPEDRADEMSRRLRRARGNVRLRLSRVGDMPILRAVVSPGFTAIEDSVILGLLNDQLRNIEVRVHRLDVTERMTSVLIALGQPQHTGGVVGAVWGSITITNSNVGWAGLSVSLSLYRLICGNGMRAPTVNAQLVQVRHHSVNLNDIRTQLAEGVRSLPVNLSQSTRIFESSAQWPVVNVEAEARALLRERGMIQGHHSGVMTAFRREPHETVFGVSQALTLHAQHTSPEDRVALEDLAGSYVLRAAH